MRSVTARDTLCPSVAKLALRVTECAEVVAARWTRNRYVLVNMS